MKATLNTVVKGHVLIMDKSTGEVLLDQDNAIHPQNMALVLARGLANEDNHQIYKIALGNGGTYIGSDLNIAYNAPNTTSSTATLYGQTYEEIVDDSAAGHANNSVISYPSILPEITASVVCSLTLAPNEPTGQAVSDGVTTNPDSLYTFDELGLMTNDPTPLLLSHIIFNPIEKTSNRELIVTYTLTISVS